MSRDPISRGLDIAILVLTVSFGILFVLVEFGIRSVDPLVMERADLIFTLAFLVLFPLQVGLIQDKRQWLRKNWLDVLIVIVAALPLLRLLRFYRYLPAARALRLMRVALLLGESLRSYLRTYDRGNFSNILLAAGVVVFMGPPSSIMWRIPRMEISRPLATRYGGPPLPSRRWRTATRYL